MRQPPRTQRFEKANILGKILGKKPTRFSHRTIAHQVVGGLTLYGMPFYEYSYERQALVRGPGDAEILLWSAGRCIS
jgi:hypothetical protein